MVSKGDLGFAYLVAVGIGIFGAFVSGILIPFNSATLVLTTNVLFAIVSGLTVTGGFILAGFGLARSDLPDERIWQVAKWSALGLGVPTVVTVLLLVFDTVPVTGLDWRSVTILNIAGGGIVGILFGAITELRAEHTRTKALNERNTVFLRLFRHDIRNSINAIIGHVEVIEDDATVPKGSIEVIEDHVGRILHLSDAARQLDEVGLAGETEPIDLVEVLDRQLSSIESRHPAVDIVTDLPPETFVLADDLLQSALENLLTNAIDHNDAPLTIHVSVDPPGPGDSIVTLRIRDDGQGFTEDELEIHSGARETALRHSSGIGLWLSRWIVDSYGGELTVANAETGGAVVSVKLPSAD